MYSLGSGTRSPRHHYTGKYQLMDVAIILETWITNVKACYDIPLPDGTTRTSIRRGTIWSARLPHGRVQNSKADIIDLSLCAV